MDRIPFQVAYKLCFNFKGYTFVGGFWLHIMNRETGTTNHSFTHSSHYAEISSPPSFILRCMFLLSVEIPQRIKVYFSSKRPSERILSISCGVFVGLLLYYYALYFTLVVFGFAFGYFACAPDMPSDLIYQVHKQVMTELFTPHCKICQERSELCKTQEEKIVKLNLPNPLHDKLMHIIELVIRDFIDEWYLGLNNFSKERRFQTAVIKSFKEVLNLILETILARQPGELCTSIATALCTLLQRHIKEYKKYQRLCSRGEFLKAKNILSLNYEREQEYLLKIASIIIIHLIPGEESKGNVSRVFLEELVGNVIIKEFVDVLSEANFLNTQIVDFLDFEKERLYLKTRKGYCLLRIRLIRGRNIVSENLNSEFFHVTLVMCNKKLKSKKKHIASSPEFNEEFKFKIPDSIAKNDLENSVIVSLKETNIFKVNEYIGTFEFYPLLLNLNQVVRSWHTLIDGNTGKSVGELELEYSLMKCQGELRQDLNHHHVEKSNSSLDVNYAEAGFDEDEVFINLGHVLSNHEFFLEFYSFLTEQKVHAYLHLWVSIDSFMRAFLKNTSSTSSLSLGNVDENNLKSEAKLIFSSHFDENIATENLIPHSNETLYNFKNIIFDSNSTTEQIVDCMRRSQDFLYSFLEEFYFPLFKETHNFKRLKMQLYKEQHEAFLAGASKSIPIEIEIEKSSNYNPVDFVGCKLECKLHVKGEKNSNRSSNSIYSTHSTSQSLQHSIPFVSYLAPVTSALVSPFTKSPSVSFVIDVSLTSPFNYRGLSLSSYSITRSYSELHHWYKQILKRFPSLSYLFFPQKKVSNEENRKQMEYQMKNFLIELSQVDAVCKTDLFSAFLFPNSKEQEKLRGNLSIDFDDSTSCISNQTTSSFASTFVDTENTNEQESKRTFQLKNLFKKKKKHSVNVSEHHFDQSTLHSPIQSASNSQLVTPIEPVPGSKNENFTNSSGKFLGVANMVSSNGIFDECSSIYSHSSGENVDIFLDSLFSLVKEAFDVSGVGQWIKRQILNTVKQIFKQTQSDSLKNMFEKEVATRFSYAHLASYLTDLECNLWPDGKLKKAPIFTKEEEETLASEAKSIFLRIMPDSMNTLLGKGKVTLSLSRLFFMIQHQEFNKIFIYEAIAEILEIIFFPTVIDTKE